MSNETDEPGWGNIVTARRLRNHQVQVTMDTGEDTKRRGPWSLIVDEAPQSGGEGVGPSPINLTLGALAA
jgi:uncharacterized OsmC-like protein